MTHVGYDDEKPGDFKDTAYSAIENLLHTKIRRFSLEKDCVLGKGKTGVVYALRDRITNKDYAAKVCANDRGALWEAAMFDAASAALKDKRVLPEIFGRYVHRGWLITIMARLDRVPLSAKYANEMRRCLAQLHEAGFSHGDIHIGNFMADIATDTIRIIDLGLAYDYKHPTTFLPAIPRGKREPLTDWSRLVAKTTFTTSITHRCADYHLDNMKLEAIIDTLPL